MKTLIQFFITKRVVQTIILGSSGVASLSLITFAFTNNSNYALGSLLAIVFMVAYFFFVFLNEDKIIRAD